MSSPQPQNFSVTDGYLVGPTGRWRLANIKGAYKRQGGRLDLKKWLTTLAGMTAGAAAMSWNPIGGAILALGSVAYCTHGTMRVFALIDGHEVEILAEPYISPWWREDAANRACDELIALIADAQRRNA